MDVDARCLLALREIRICIGGARGRIKKRRERPQDTQFAKLTLY